MEQLSIASFLQHGHDYRLFTYEEVEGLPEGAIREDARAILPESMIFQYQKSPSYAGFSNYFRYKMLLELGGWWADTDLVCLRLFDCDEPYIFASEMTQDGREVPTSCALKAPAGSDAMSYAWDACRRRDPKGLVWGETGPRLVGQTITHFGLECYRQPARAFCPLAFYEWRRLIEPDGRCHFGESTWAVHLWNETWRRAGADKDHIYAPECPYEQLKRRYLRAREIPTED
jgi:hypothetical protein